MTVPLSVLDLAPVAEGQTVGDSLRASVDLARAAEAAGYRRVWYAEHHNMPTIASSATAVVVAHVAAHTSRIRLGAGGVMLPNHSPLVVAEQFGTLASLHPGRIDLGLGRAPGSDRTTTYALRRDPAAAERFPDDVVELQAYLAGESRVPGVQAVPGAGTRVPLYVLGSSLYGAQVAAALGLPYAFASHFAPAMLEQAVALYRRDFRPSEQLAEPYVLAAVNVVADHDATDAQRQLATVRRSFVKRILQRGPDAPLLGDDEVDALLASAQGAQLADMLRYSVAGTPEEVREYLDRFAAHADADELVVAFQSPDPTSRVRSLELTAAATAVAA
ncbi:LLM class flavin-dependent oxidoreductase [Aquipuribacter nitratireducens]|uniref:LLM class flavin-dependent oxidoreductase n=1 Tax=Aquipuribacter nitratireducens TaxID=650104 RepID=A0ABW0GH45_9MICO